METMDMFTNASSHEGQRDNDKETMDMFTNASSHKNAILPSGEEAEMRS